MAGRNNTKEMREEAIRKKGRKKGGKLRKPETFKNDQLSGLLKKMMELPEFKHLNPKQKRNKKSDFSRNTTTIDNGGMKMKGKVKWFNVDKGFGFVAGEDGRDCFIHISGISENADILILTPGMQVEYEPVKAEKGLKATNLTTISK